jgi:hypothetical protein
VNLIDRPRGFQAGLARSEEFNKAWRQASVMVAAVAEFIDQRVAGNVVDDGNVTYLAQQLAQAISTIASSGGIADAPSDGRWFLRRNAGWIDTTNLALDGGTW